MKKMYAVELPITGVLCIEVEAGSEGEAIRKALESERRLDMIETWEAHYQIVEGNVFRGLKNRATAEEN